MHKSLTLARLYLFLYSITIKFLHLTKNTCTHTHKTHECKHDPNTPPSMRTDCYYTPKHKQRHAPAKRHMRELKCPLYIHEREDKHKYYMHSQQKAHTQDRKVVDAHEWCGWAQWGNVLQGDMISGHGSANMSTDDLYFAHMAGGQQEQKQQHQIWGEKRGKKAKRTQRADTSPRH